MRDILDYANRNLSRQRLSPCDVLGFMGGCDRLPEQKDFDINIEKYVDGQGRKISEVFSNITGTFSKGGLITLKATSVYKFDVSLAKSIETNLDGILPFTCDFVIPESQTHLRVSINVICNASFETIALHKSTTNGHVRGLIFIPSLALAE